MQYLSELRSKIHTHKRNLHYKLLAENHSLFRLFDIILIIIILMNFGAVFFTSFSISKNTDVNFYEANPIQAKLNNYQTSPKAKAFFLNFIINVLIWTGLIFCYIYFKNTIYTEFQLFIFMTTFIASFFLIGLDFWHNAGYWFGMLLK